MTESPITRRNVLRLGAASLGTLTLAACSNDASTRAASKKSTATTAAPLSKVPEVPAGTTIRVGDQLEYLATILKLGKQDQDFPYTVEYSAFVGGPPMLQAFQAEAIDLGFVGSTPLIFAQAAGQAIRAVAGWSTQHSSYSLVTAPGGTGVGSWKEAKGKRVAFQKGTALQAAALQALDNVGLKLDDITIVDIPFNQIAAALQSGSADVGVLSEPLLSSYLTANPTAKVVDTADEPTDRSSFAIASNTALANEATEAAIADYLYRVATAIATIQKNPEEFNQTLYVERYKLTPERAAEVAKKTGPTRVITIPDDIEKSQQRLADLFFTNGVIPKKVDVGDEFDDRFATLLKRATS